MGKEGLTHFDLGFILFVRRQKAKRNNLIVARGKLFFNLMEVFGWISLENLGTPVSITTRRGKNRICHLKINWIFIIFPVLTNTIPTIRVV